MAKQKTTKTQMKKTQQAGRSRKASTSTTKSAPKTSRDPRRAGPFYIKWQRPDGSLKVTEYNYDPNDRHMKEFTRQKWIRFCITSGESIDWACLGKKSKPYKELRAKEPLKFT